MGVFKTSDRQGVSNNDTWRKLARDTPNSYLKWPGETIGGVMPKVTGNGEYIKSLVWNGNSQGKNPTWINLTGRPSISIYRGKDAA